MEQFERAERGGYALVSWVYLRNLEKVVEAARRAFFDPNEEWSIEDALRAMGKI